MDFIWSVSLLFLRTQDGIAEQVLEYPIHRLSQLKKLKFNSQTRICYFIGRNCYRKKMLWGKSCNLGNFFFSNNIIFHSSQLFHPATYTLRVLIDVPCLLVFDFFHTPYTPPTPIPVYYFFEFVWAKKNNFFFTMSDIHALNDIHARYYQILLIFLTLIVVWG